MEYKVLRCIGGFDVGETFTSNKPTFFHRFTEYQISFLINWWFLEEVKKEPKFKIWDMVVRDIRFFDKKERWRFLDYEIVNKILLDWWIISQINGINYETYRLATDEEINLYFKK